MGWMTILTAGFLLLLLAVAWSAGRTHPGRRDREDSLRIAQMKRDRGEISESEYRRFEEILKG